MAPALRSGWQLSLYSGAGEAGGSFQGLGRPGRGGSGWDYDPERPASEAVRRARAQVRRYCAANLLNRFGTLTYAGGGCHDPLAARADVARFFRRLRVGLGGERLPYVWVPELHPGGHGFHFHIAVARYIARGLIEEAWGHGFVHITLIGDLPVGSGAREEARVAARYLSKYLGKGFSAGGLNRYDVAQGFQPKAEPITGPTEAGVIGEAAERMGGPPDVLWRSVNEPGWRAPQAVWLQWR
jgi:hypothetical protein